MDKVRRKDGVNSHRISFCVSVSFPSYCLSNLYSPQTEVHWVILMFVIYLSGGFLFLICKKLCYICQSRLKPLLQCRQSEKS